MNGTPNGHFWRFIWAMVLGKSQDMRIAHVTESGFLAVFMCLVWGDIGDTGSAAPSYKDSISLCLPSRKWET